MWKPNFWPFRPRKTAAQIEDERPISPFELGQMWIEANRKSQQRFYDFLAERGAEASAEQLAKDRARMRKVEIEASSLTGLASIRKERRA